MADGKSPSDKTGPVKPPVLEGTARAAARPQTSRAQTGKAETAKPEPAKPAPTAETPPKPIPDPVRPTATAGGLSPVWPALGGGVLGLVAAYGLAWAGLWPSQPAEPSPADPRIEQLAGEIPELRTVAETTQSELATLTQRMGQLESGAPAADANPVDLGGIEADIAALTSRLDGLANAPADGGDTEALAVIREAVSGVDARVNELAARMGTAEASVTSLGSRVTATSEALDAQPSDIGAVLQLPLILSGFEAAFGSGRPYETELAALRAAVPDVAVPTAIANGASTGLARPDAIASRFNLALPAMLAGRPADPDASWQDGAVDWFRSVVALRPTGEIEGDDPEAVVARLEAAIARRDFTAAESLLASLPQPMLAAAGEVPAEIAAQAEAGRFLDGLRQKALGGAGAS